MMDFCNLVLYFTIYSFLGWAMETAFASINERKLINRGFLSGFVCPIYGSGAILILLSSELVKREFGGGLISLAVNVLFAILFVTVLEFLTGLTLEKIFNCKWWDYSDNAFNIKGYICLKYSLLWGVLTLIFIRAIHPAVSEVVYFVPATAKSYLVAMLLLYFFADTVKTIADALDLRKVIMNFSSISVNRYHEKIIEYRRFFAAFPRLLILNAGVINRDIRSILNERLDKIKVQLRSRFL